MAFFVNKKKRKGGSTMINKVVLIGRVGIVETRTSQSGISVTRLRIVTQENGGQQEHTEWHSVICFGRTAEVVGQYLEKGRLVYVEGRLRTRTWEVNGEKRSTVEVHADSVRFLDGKKSSSSTTVPPQEVSVAEAVVAPPTSDPYPDDDIPF